MKVFYFLSLLLLPVSGSAAALAWQDYTYTTHDKVPLKIPGQVARLIAPENPTLPAGAQVDLMVIRLPATTATPGAPTIYLHGGPGGSSAEHLEAPAFRALFDALRTQGDVILFDQRGCGQSLPSLLPAAKTPRIQTGTLATREAFLDYLSGISTTIRDQLAATGHDARQYNVVNSAEDIEALRRAVGVEKINLLGHSYGTQLAQAYVRAHPAAVGRMILAGARGMDTSRKLPAEADEFLARLAALAKTDPVVGAKFPDLLATLDRVMAKLDRAPVTVEIEGSGGKFDLKVGGYALRFFLAKFYLKDPDSFKYLPKLLDELDTGRRPWCLVFNLSQIMRGGVSFAWFTTDAASGVTPARDQLIAQQATTARLRDAMNFPFPEINRTWGMADLGDAFRAPVQCDTPTLFVVGMLDGITPAAQTREIMAGFAHAHLLTVANGGHDSSFGAPGVADAVAGFLAGRTPPETASLPPAQFMPLIAAGAK